MKELSEYKNEIFRRSDEKKRQLQKRRRIAIGVTVPLCLCCAVTAAVFSGGALMPKMEAVADMESLNNKIALEEATFHITDPEQTAQILLLLEGELQENKDHNYGTADKIEPEGYRMTLELPDGSVLTYQVLGETLYCEATGENLSLTPAQAEALYQLLLR